MGQEYSYSSHRLDLIILVKRRSEQEVLIANCIGEMKIFSYIRPTLKHFVSLLNLEKSSLMAAILKPSTFDFSIGELKTRVHKPYGKLNRAQENAVSSSTQLCLGNKANIGLIHGPPGTGKSHVIINLILNIMSESMKTLKIRPKILLCAPTNAAVDQLVLKLKDIRATLPEARKFKLIRTGQVDRKSHVFCVTPESLAETHMRKEASKDMDDHELDLSILQGKRNSLTTLLTNLQSDSTTDKLKIEILEKKIEKIDKALVSKADKPRFDKSRQQREFERTLIKNADIIATTLSSCTNDQMVNALTDFGCEHPSITCCIIDEAAQCNETELLLPLSLDVTKMILVGDPLQLKATTFSKVSRQMGYGGSLFSRINTVWEKGNLPSSLSPIHFLDTQYRMHSSIANWPASFIYGNRLKTDNSCQKFSELAAYTLLNHNFKQSREKNFFEADIVVKLAQAILKKLKNPVRIGIITPYSAQKSHIQNLISKSCENLREWLEVNSIDGFQGQEREIIIVSMVRSEGIGFMDDIQRVNVMLTRAQKCLILCANFKAFSNNIIWKSLYDNALRRQKTLDVNGIEDRELNRLTALMFSEVSKSASHR